MKLLNFIICDDIRTEMGNKHSLMGVYDNTIEFYVTPDNKNSWPKIMKLGFFARAILDETDINKNISSFKLKVEFNNERIEIGGGAFPKDKIAPSVRMNLAIVHNSFLFQGPGNMKIIYEFYDSNNNIIETISPDSLLLVSEKIITNTL